LFDYQWVELTFNGLVDEVLMSRICVVERYESLFFKKWSGIMQMLVFLVKQGII